jgi:hypothetical protein
VVNPVVLFLEQTTAKRRLGSVVKQDTAFFRRQVNGLRLNFFGRQRSG